MLVFQVFVSSEKQPTDLSIHLLGSFSGEFPLSGMVDITFDGEEYKHGLWVTIMDESRLPLTLSEIRVYGSK